MHKGIFHVRVYRYPNTYMDTEGITYDTCMASMKNNIFQAVFCITHVKENSNHNSNCSLGWNGDQGLT